MTYDHAIEMPGDRENSYLWNAQDIGLIAVQQGGDLYVLIA
jgi:hypothetical protein